MVLVCDTENIGKQTFTVRATKNCALQPLLISRIQLKQFQVLILVLCSTKVKISNKITSEATNVFSIPAAIVNIKKLLCLYTSNYLIFHFSLLLSIVQLSVSSVLFVYQYYVSNGRCLLFVTVGSTILWYLCINMFRCTFILHDNILLV